MNVTTYFKKKMKMVAVGLYSSPAIKSWKFPIQTIYAWRGTMGIFSSLTLGEFNNDVKSENSI